MKTHIIILICAIVFCSCHKSDSAPSVSNHLATVGLSTDKHYVINVPHGYSDTFTINADNTITTYGATFPVIIGSYHSNMFNSPVVTLITTDRLERFPLSPAGPSSVYIYWFTQDTCYLYFTKFSSTDSGYRLVSSPATGKSYDYRVTVY